MKNTRVNRKYPELVETLIIGERGYFQALRLSE